MSFTTHDDYINSPTSEKIVLAHIHSSKRLYNFKDDASLVSRTVDHFVSKVTLNDNKLIKVNSVVELSDTSKYYYEPSTSKLYLFNFEQDTDEVIVEFRFFLSNIPIVLSWDLSESGHRVTYEPRIITTPKFKSQMSQNKKGINLVGNGRLVVNNNDGHYDGIYDSLFWENKLANVYSYNRELSPTEAKLFFRGIITGKSFATDKITFSLNDDLYSLDQLVPSEMYGNSVTEDDSTNRKRIIYGRVKNLQAQSLDKYGDSGTTMSGTISGIAGDTFITGTGTSFLKEVSNGDILILNGFSVVIDKVKSNTLIRCSQLERTFSSLSVSLNPSIQYSNRNRTFQVAGHALKKISTFITKIISRNRINVNDSSDFEAGDTIDLAGEEKKIRRVSGNSLILNTNYNLNHEINDVVSKKEVFNIRYENDSNIIIPSDFSISNQTEGTTISLSQNAEVNSSKTRNLKQKLTFINGSSGVWLGSPSRHKIELVKGNKFEKYFIVYDVEGESTAFWFKDTAPELSTQYREPEHGADNSVAVSLQVNDPDLASLASTIERYINANLDNFYAIKGDDHIIIESINSEAIGVPNAGDSSFTMTHLTLGIELSHNLDFNDYIKVRDYIVGPDGTDYEVLEVYEKSIKLRTNYNGVSGNFQMNYKNVSYINDDSILYLDCYGKTKDGTSTGDFISTVPEVAEDLLKGSGLSEYINTNSFTNSAERASQLVSISLPYSIDIEMPSIKDVINKLNKSVIGSLFIDQDLNLGYDILDCEIPSNTIRTIRDEDVIKWSVSGDSYDIVKTVLGKYRISDYNPSTQENGNNQVSYTSDFVSKYVGNENSKELTLQLYNEDDAQEMVERDQFINSLSNSKIKISGSLNLSKFNLGERVLLDLKRLYVALGSSDSSQRIGIVSSTKQTGERVEIEIEDVGAMYTRSARISSDESPDYSEATDKEKVTDSYITGDNEIIDTEEDTFSTNLIS